MKIAATEVEINSNCCDSVGSALPSSVRVIPRSRRSVTGYQSWRRQHSIQYESTLERDFIVRQEFDLAVAEVISQPCRIPFIAPSGRHSYYTPDFLVTFKTSSAPPSAQSKPLLIEVKPEADWRRHWREWLAKWKAAKRYAELQGWRFRIMDESRIRTPALTNIQFLRRYRDTAFPVEESDAIVKDVRDLGSATFDYLLAKHFQGIYAAEGVAHLWGLLAQRRLDCDICLPLGGSTELWVPDED